MNTERVKELQTFSDNFNINIEKALDQCNTNVSFLYHFSIGTQ